MSKKQLNNGRIVSAPSEGVLRTALEFYITGEYGLQHPERTNGAASRYVHNVAGIIAANRSRFPTMMEEFEMRLMCVLAAYGERGTALRREYEKELREASIS